MIPIRDGLPTRRFPFVTIFLILANVAVFMVELLVQGAGGERALSQMLYDWGVVPARIAVDPLPLTLVTFLTSMFLHGGLLHIGGNMLYLWIFGDNVEDVMGHLGFLAFYLASGLVAGMAQLLASAGSNVPAIGASGAIAGVLAAYLVFYPTARVETLIILGYWMRLRRLPAIFVLGLWFVLQLFNGLLTLGIPQAGGVAWFAHIGGFVAGLVLALPWIGRARRLGMRWPRSMWY